MSDEGEFEAPYVYDCGQDHGQLFPNLVKDGLPTLHPDYAGEPPGRKIRDIVPSQGLVRMYDVPS